MCTIFDLVEFLSNHSDMLLTSELVEVFQADHLKHLERGL